MGDRANVQFVWPARNDAEPQKINLYAHWAGGSLAACVAGHLGSEVARRRWGDHEYLVRIVVQRTMNDLFDPDVDYGGGLSPEMGDNEHAVLVLDVENRTYSLGPAEGTWEELCALSPAIVTAMAG